MTREELLKQLIEKKFNSIKAFSEYIGLPYTTVRSILERGIGKAGVDNVIKICKGLNLSPDKLADDLKIDEYIADTLSIMYSLSQKGQENVYNFAKKELKKQHAQSSNSDQSENIYTLAAHADDPSKKYTDEEIDHIHSVLEKARKNYEDKKKK